jgi:hypothetical protein
MLNWGHLQILVHEAGHWVGLYHTFEGGCSGGDGVADTPPEASPARECRQRDSCPGDGLLDPISKFQLGLRQPVFPLITLQTTTWITPTIPAVIPSPVVNGSELTSSCLIIVGCRRHH